MDRVVLTYRGNAKIGSIIRDAVERERRIKQIALSRTMEKLRRLEERYSLSSEEFYRRMEAGEMDDRDDFVDWAGEYEIFSRLKEEIEAIEGASFEDR